MLAAVKVLLPPLQIVAGLATAEVITGFGFMVTTIVVVLAQPAVPLSLAVNVIVYAAPTVGVTVIDEPEVLLKPAPVDGEAVHAKLT